MLNLFSYGLGKSYDIKILIGRVSNELWEAYEKQGGSLDEVNSLRDKFKLYKLNPKSNVKIVKKAWAKNVVNGRGCVILIQKFAYKLAENKEITNAIDWMYSQLPEVKIDKISVGSYDVFYLGYKFKEQKEESIKQEQVEQPLPTETNNEAAV